MIYKLSDISTFGKHSGRLWSWVLAYDPPYLEWAYATIDGFSIEGMTLDDIFAYDSNQPEWMHYESE
jgi:hypothetical protein